MKILVINGPNMNLLGLREPDIYGRNTYAELVKMIEAECARLGIECECLQSNHEGAIVDIIQQAYGEADAIVINPAAYTHTSIAILDALKAVAIPYAEVHISDITAREAYRSHSYISEAAVATIVGHGFDGYIEAIRLLYGIVAREN